MPKHAAKKAKQSGKEDGAALHADAWLDSAYASRYQLEPIPKKKLPQEGMPANIAYQVIKDARQLDGNPRLDLASFTTTWMEPEAEKLILESLAVNYVDMETTPSTTDIQNRCVEIIADLFHAPAEAGKAATGAATIGSSEAIMLGALAMKRRWEEGRRAQGKPTSSPNLVMGYNVQVCWEKATNYFSIEERFVHMTEQSFVATPEGIAKLVDENTIGVVGILGSTYTGEFEDIQGIDRMIGELNRKNGWSVGIHVDAASGGFIAPFTNPNLLWDFRLPNVVSINVSGHKYGLVYPGLGWVLWRSRDFLPESLLFHLSYLGSDEISFTMNFSKGGSTILAQYYQFLRLGWNGYRRIMMNLVQIATHLRDGFLSTGHFEVYSKPDGVPLVAAGLKQVEKDGKLIDRPYTCFDVADKLRSRGWVVPAYHMAPDAGHVTLLRCVVREDFSISMADELIADVHRVIEWLDHHFVFTETTLKSHDARLHTPKHRPHAGMSKAHSAKKKKFNAGVC